MISRDRLLRTFIDLVKIDSPSGEEKKISREIIKRLQALGGSVKTDSYGNIIAKFKGDGEPFMINSHLDTVEPGRGIKPTIRDDKIISDGRTILGGDAKAGVAEILEALTSIKEEKHTHVPLDIVFTLSEEMGLQGAINLDYSKISAERGVTFDGEGNVATIINSSPGYNRVDVTITGRGAHAGLEPEKGISAIKIAAEIIAKLKVGRIDHETTANIGIIEGGSARNAVPENVHFKAEIRSRDLKKLEKHSLHFEKIFNEIIQKHPEAHMELKIERAFNPYLFAENHHIIARVKKALLQIGQTPKLTSTGGAADVNIFHAHGIEAVCVGIGVYEPHTVREFVMIHEMLKAAQFCEKIVRA